MNQFVLKRQYLLGGQSLFGHVVPLAEEAGDLAIVVSHGLIKEVEIAEHGISADLTLKLDGNGFAQKRFPCFVNGVHQGDKLLIYQFRYGVDYLSAEQISATHHILERDIPEGEAMFCPFGDRYEIRRVLVERMQRVSLSSHSFHLRAEIDERDAVLNDAIICIEYRMDGQGNPEPPTILTEAFHIDRFGAFLELILHQLERSPIRHAAHQKLERFANHVDAFITAERQKTVVRKNNRTTGFNSVGKYHWHPGHFGGHDERAERLPKFVDFAFRKDLPARFVHNHCIFSPEHEFDMINSSCSKRALLFREQR